MAEFDAPKTAYIKVGGAWKQVDLIDAGASKVKVAGTWKDIMSLYVKINGTWLQALSNVNPANPTLVSRAFTNTSFTMSWNNPPDVYKYEIKRRLQSAADTEGNYTDVVAKTTTIATTMDNLVDAGTVGTSMSNPVNGSTTNVQGPRYVYRIRVWDGFGHMGELQVDTLRGRVISPLFVRPTNSATWRGTAFRVDGTVQAADLSYTRCIQGYTATGMNYGHYWYGGSGNGIINNCFSNTLLPTCTAADMMGCRDAGGIGDGAGGVKPQMWMHAQLARGTTNAWSNNGTGTYGGTSQLRETQYWQSFGTTNGTSLIAGTSYRGICLYDSNTTVESYGTSTSYYVGYSYTEPQSSNYPGTIRLTHSG